MARLGPKDRIVPKIFGPKKTRTARFDKVRPRKLTRPSARLENGNPSCCKKFF